MGNPFHPRRTPEAYPGPMRTLASVLLVLALTACPDRFRVVDDPLSLGAEGNRVPGDGSSGIEGTVLVGPQCPVVREGEDCPDRPLAAKIEVKAGERLVARFSSDAQGKFRVPLAPGAYSLVPEGSSGNVLPRGIPQDVTVTAGQFAPVSIQYDSGIR